MKIVAEIGINHNGDLGIAGELILMAAQCGADYVKFQKRTIDKVYTREFLDSPRESPWGKTQRAQKERLEFNQEQYEAIDRLCMAAGIKWFSSCWDEESLEFIERFNPPLHKVASAMLTNLPFLEKVASLGRKTLVSTGMSGMGDIRAAVDIFKDFRTPFVVMHAVSEYPCPDENTNLAAIPLLKEWINGEVGYSNHSPGIESCIGAAYLGAEWIEVHVTLDRSMYGSDQAASLERRGLELVCKYCKNSEKILGTGEKRITAGEKVNAAKLRYWEGIVK